MVHHPGRHFFVLERQHQDAFNVLDVKAVWYKNETHKSRRPKRKQKKLSEKDWVLSSEDTGDEETRRQINLKRASIRTK